MGDLEELKRVLRSLVVSTPTTIDAATLLRDYRRMVGRTLPVASYGYRDPVLFLREQCADSFLFQGPQSNPVLTLIVNKSIKHIDQLVQSQRMPKQLKGKRRSVPESIIRHIQPHYIANTFKPAPKLESNRYSFSNHSSSANNSPSHSRPQPTYTEPRKQDPAPCRPITKAESPTPVPRPVTPKLVGNAARSNSAEEAEAPREPAGTHTRRRLQQYLEAYREQHGSADSLRNTDTDSGRQTSSSSSGRSAAALAQLKDEIARLVGRQPEPVRVGQLLQLYEEEYGRQLNFSRFGFASVSACACAVEALAARRAPDGDWLLSARDARTPPPVLRVRRARVEHASRASLAPLDPDDALPWIDYDPDVFPADCLSFLESIPAGSVAGVSPGDMLPVAVGEVYSPSHLWLLRLGADYDTMEEYMDQMTEYYTSGEGRDRVLAAGARRPGQYCSSVFDGDWHRSLIVQVLDVDTVKVLHVDYGTVDTVCASALRPLRRQWAGLPALAVRALLAGLRPSAASRRWPRAAAAHCLELVRERHLVANVVAVDREENILEIFLIDTSTEEDVNITERMIRAGHADPRPLPALGTRESYLFPLFRVLEAGETPNYAEIHALLRDGIALEFVDSYRRHVPALMPDAATPPDATLDDAASPPDCALDDARRAADGRDADTSELGSSAGSCPSPSPSPSSSPSPSPSPPPPAAGNRVPFAMLLPARADALAPPAWVSMTSVATSTSLPPATPPPPAVPQVFTFSAPPAPPAAPPTGTEAPSSAASTLALAPAPAATRAPSLTSFASSPAPEPPLPRPPPPPAPSSPAASGPPQPRGSSPHMNERAVYVRSRTDGSPQTDGSGRAGPCCVGAEARPSHPAAVYALPYCPCSAAGPCCPRPPPPYAFAPRFTPRFAPAPYPYAGYRPAPPRPAPPLPYYTKPPPPRQWAGAAEVRLSATECEVFEKLSRVDPGTAHRYMMEALGRARAQAELRAARPPPGFENGPEP